MNTNVAALSLREALEWRTTTLNAFFKRDLAALNNYAQGRTDDVDLKKIQTRVQKLNELNRHIEQKKQEALDNPSWCHSCSRVQTSTWIILFLQFIGFASIAGISIYDLTQDENSNQKKTNLAKTIISIAALAATTVFTMLIKGITDDYDKFRLLAKVSRIEEKVHSHYINFLENLETFHQERTQKNLTNCITELERIPYDNYISVPTQLWLPRLIDLMDDKHPLKVKFKLLENEANKIFETTSSRTNRLRPIDGTEYTRIPIPSNSKEDRSSSSIVDDVDETSMSDEDSTKEKFSGETLSNPLLNHSAGGSKRNEIHSKSLRSLQEKWSDVENEMGMPLTCLKVHNSWLDRNGKKVPVLDADET